MQLPSSAVLLAHLVAVLLFRTASAVSVSVPITARDDVGDCRYAEEISGTVPLVAGQTIDAGTVSYTITDNGGGTFTADVSVNVGGTGSCTVSPDVHVDLVSSPKTRGRELAPGRWPCAARPTDNAFDVSCPVSGLSCCDTKYLYVHVVVLCNGEYETAFGGDESCSGSRWCRYVEVAPPCGDCSCDTVNDRCFIKDSCPAFPASCTVEPICENLIPTGCEAPTDCTGDQLKCTEKVCPGSTQPGVPTTCITPQACSGTVGVDHCSLDTVCDPSTECASPSPCPNDKCGGPICEDLAGTPDLPSTVKTMCDDKQACTGTVGIDHCSLDSVCDPSTECVSPSPCAGDKCGGPICANLAGTPDLPSTVKTMCDDKQACTGTVGIDHCSLDSVCDPSTECVSPSPCSGDKCGGPICANLAGTPDLPSTVKTMCVDKQTCPGTAGVDHCAAGPVCDTTTECPAVSTCETDEQCNGEFYCPSPNTVPGVPETCTGRVDCMLPGCDISACPGSCPTTCPGVCPPCFKENTSGSGPKCLPDANEDCNPCENGGNALCDEAVGLNKFKCCPETSNCKSGIIPTRLGMPQDQIPVSFVCSANCGVCDTVTSKGDSNACVLFSELNLGSDGDSGTDDILNVCDDLSVQT